MEGWQATWDDYVEMSTVMEEEEELDKGGGK